MLLHVLLDSGGKRGARGMTGPEHDKSLRLDQVLVVFPRDDRSLEHRGMSNDRGLDLRRRNPDAADLEHVVVAPAVYVVARFIAPVLVAAARPFAHEGGARLRPVVPVRHRRRRAFDEELACSPSATSRPCSSTMRSS